MYSEPFEPIEILGMADVYTMDDSICPKRNRNYVTLKKEAWDKVQTALREYARLIVRCGVNVQKGQTVIVHRIKNSSVHGLQAVSHVRQGTGNDDAHGILDKGLLYLLFHVHVNDLLIFKLNVT